MKPPCLIHELPSAPAFAGREKELGALRAFARSSTGVASLVGQGGAGKTAILAKFVQEAICDSLYEGVLVWSFYDEPDTNAFLKTTVEYVSGMRLSAMGAGWFHALRRSLDLEPKFLFVLDGLERVQRPVTDAKGIYGELEDPLLRGFLTRLAEGPGASQALITSRFPASDLERIPGEGHLVLDIDLLDCSTATEILGSAHGIDPGSDEVKALLAAYGTHALTVDLLGSLIRRFFGGNPCAIPKPPSHSIESVDRLRFLLELYQAKASRDELELLSRLCVFRFGVEFAALHAIFPAGPDEAATQAMMTALVDTHLVHRDVNGRLSVHPAIRDHFYSVFRDANQAHGQISDHLLSLTDRPGVGAPTEKAALDLLEELIYHSLKAGREDEAYDIYARRLGGNEHLSVNLGDYHRTFRILNAFPEIPDKGAMYHCLRAFGDFKSALEWRPQNRYIRLLLGDLEPLSKDPSASIAAVAKFLLCESQIVPDRLPDMPIDSARAWLFADRVDDARRCAKADLEVALFRDDKIRARLALAEVDRRLNNLNEARKKLDEVSEWVVRSGSHEHLSQMLLYRGQLEQGLGDLAAASTSLSECRSIIEEAGFRLMGPEVASGFAKLYAAQGRFPEALEEVERGLEAARAIGFRRAELTTLRLKAKIAMDSQDADLGLATLRSLLELQKRFDAQSATQTEFEIMRISSH